MYHKHFTPGSPAPASPPSDNLPLDGTSSVGERHSSLLPSRHPASCQAPSTLTALSTLSIPNYYSLVSSHPHFCINYYSWFVTHLSAFSLTTSPQTYLIAQVSFSIHKSDYIMFQKFSLNSQSKKRKSKFGWEGWLWSGPPLFFQTYLSCSPPWPHQNIAVSQEDMFSHSSVPLNCSLPRQGASFSPWLRGLCLPILKHSLKHHHARKISLPSQVKWNAVSLSFLYDSFNLPFFRVTITPGYIIIHIFIHLPS